MSPLSRARKRDFADVALWQTRGRRDSRGQRGEERRDREERKKGGRIARDARREGPRSGEG